jgi:poly(A) polymerase
MPNRSESEQRNPRPDCPGAKTVRADAIDAAMLDQDALRVISRLRRMGHEAYLVGGCVRDLMIGRKPKDFDVATDAHPRAIKRLFKNGRIIGRRFRLVHIHYGQHIIETATFRSDPFSRETPEEEGEGRGAEAEEREEQGDLLITEDNEYGTAEEDARRRDFTVNALFLDPLEHVIHDYVGGLVDLQAGLLRTIGDPPVRLAEDPVRILRAVKFATRLGFRIDEPTWDAMCALAPSLSRSAPPRVLEEILRLMRSGTALGAMRMLRACGALRVILPQVDAYLGSKDEAADQERADTFWRLMEALDADAHQGFVPSTPVCLALLTLRLIEREADPRTRTLRGPPPDLALVASEVIDPLAISARVSRRDASRAKRLILHQKRFTQTTGRRFRPQMFLRSEEFPEALDLFRIRMAARGQGWDIYEGWRARHEAALKAPPEPEELAEEQATGAPRRRRRRRGRGGSGGRAGPGGAPAA